MIISRIGPERTLGYRAIVFLSAVVIALAFGVVLSRNWHSGVETRTEDALVRMAARPARGDIAILAMDDASVKRYGPVKTWPRSVLAAGLRRVEQGGAKWVVMDLALDKRTRTGDESLWREMANNRNVLLGMSYNAQRSAPYSPDDIRSLVFLERDMIADNLAFGANTPQFSYYLFEPPVSDFTGSARGVGVFDRETDEDGRVRSSRLVYVSKVEYPQADRPLRGKFPESQLADGAPAAAPNLALVAALRDFNLDKGDIRVRAGDTVMLAGNLNPMVDIPVDDEGRMKIRYYGPAGHYMQYSFADLMDGKVPADAFHGKVVLFGATAAGDAATDPKATPMIGMMPRVEVTANAIATILDRSYYGVYPHRILGVMILVGLIAGLALMFFSAGRAAMMALLLTVAYLALAYCLYAFGHTLLPILPGVVTILFPFLMGLLLYVGPYKPTVLESSPSYVPPAQQPR